MLVRNEHEHVRMQIIPTEVAEILLKLREQSQIMLVTEMDMESIQDVYEKGVA
jgi:hypothetical protein